MKTIYIWKNIFKVSIVCILAAILSGVLTHLLQLNNGLSMLLGAAMGVTSAMGSLSIWECWKFEW